MHLTLFTLLLQLLLLTFDLQLLLFVNRAILLLPTCRSGQLVCLVVRRWSASLDARISRSPGGGKRAVLCSTIVFDFSRLLTPDLASQLKCSS